MNSPRNISCFQLDLDPQFFNYCLDNLSPLKQQKQIYLFDQKIHQKINYSNSNIETDQLLKLVNNDSVVISSDLWDTPLPTLNKDYSKASISEFDLSKISGQLTKFEQEKLNNIQDQLESRDDESKSKYEFTAKKIIKLDDNSIIQTPQKQQTQRICFCKKSQCLKRYCDCFSIGQKCNLGCRCLDCENNSENELKRTQILKKFKSKNPNMFEQRYQNQLFIQNGCKCLKSNCQKKYCECFNAGIECSQNCACQECFNKIKQTHHHHKTIDNLLKQTQNN